MTEPLKPCPFCGNGKIIDDEDDGITCPNCGAYIDRLSVEDDVCLADVWNTRPIEDAKDDEIKRLREALEIILDSAQKDEPCVLAIKVVAYRSLKGE